MNNPLCSTVPRNVTILLADGDGKALARAGTFLERAGLTVLRETTVAEALAHDFGEIDCVVSGHTFEDGDGLSILEAIREWHPNLPFVFWANAGDGDTETRAISAGASDVVQKGLDEDRLDEGGLAALSSRIVNSLARRRGGRGIDATVRRFDGLFDSSPVGVAILDADGYVRYANMAVGELLGLAPSALVGERALAIVHPEDRNRVHETFEAILQSPADPAIAQFRCSTVDGTALAVEATVRNLLDDPRIDGILAYIRPTNADERDEVIGVDADSAPIESPLEDDLVSSQNPCRPADSPSDCQFHTVFREAFDAMVVVDDGGVIVDANPAACELAGLERATLLGRSPEDFLEEDHDYEDVRAWVREANPERGVVSIHRPDGERRHVEFAVSSDVLPGHHLAVVRDVTDREVRKRELERSEYRYRTLVENFPNGIVTLFDEELRYSTVGGSGFDQLGLSAADIEGRTFEEAFPAENVATLKPKYLAALDGETDVNEVELDGRIFRVYTLPVRDANGTVFAGMTMSQDVTDQKAYEAELDAARKKYRALIETAPDPIFVADAETGTIVEVNGAAEELRGQSREEIVGLHQTDLHPSERAEEYRRTFERHVYEGGTMNRLLDGTPAMLVTDEGDRVPVSVSAETLELDGQKLIHGIFRDVSDQRWYEETLEAIARTSRNLLEADTDRVVAEHVVDVATDVLDFPSAAVLLFDTDAGILWPAAFEGEGWTDGKPPSISPGTDGIWQAFAERETVVLDGERATVFSDEDQSSLVVPLGEHGVLLAGGQPRRTFERVTLELVEVLTTNVEAALDRADSYRTIRQRDSELRGQNRRLERLNRINQKIRRIVRALVQAETHEAVVQSVCDQLHEIDQFEYAWVGEVDPMTNELVPKVWAGVECTYLDTVSLAIVDEEGREPAIRAATTGSTAVVSNVADGVQQEPWRTAALLCDFRSAISIPLRHDGVSFGVLTIYGSRPTAFDDLSRTVLDELGELIGYALDAVDRKQVGVSTFGVDLTFQVHDSDSVFVDLTRQLGCHIEIKDVTTRSDSEYLLHVLVRDVDPDCLVAQASESQVIEEVRLISDGEAALFEFIVVDRCLAATAIEFGGSPTTVTHTDDESRLTVRLPNRWGTHAFVEKFQAAVPGVELIAQYEREGTAEPQRLSAVIDQLTDRQQEVLEAAYFGGFFEQPRTSTGAEIAASLGISQPAFSQHLRACERKFVKAFVDPA